MINRVTPPHLDYRGHPAGFDLLACVGTAFGAFMDFPGIGARVPYPPGSVVLISAKVLKHSVPAWGAGDRICWAQWMREAVIDRVVDMLKPTPWATELTVLQGLEALALPVAMGS